MTDVLIINSPLFREKIARYDEDSLPPLGLGYIATNLRSRGLDVSLLDAVAHNIPLADLLADIARRRPDFVALNVFTPNFQLVKEIIEGSQAHFIVGGKTTKEAHQDIVRFAGDNEIDIVIGDGEMISADIVSGAVSTPPMLELPKRRVHKIDEGSPYFPLDISNLPLDRTFFTNEPGPNHFGQLEANIVTSRGCLYNCAFCGAARSRNREYPIRMRSTQSVKTEVMQLREKHAGLESIRVLDDLFLRNNLSIQAAICVFEGKLLWRAMAHILSFRNVSAPLLKRLRDSGCNELFIGIESGSEQVLRRIHKPHAGSEVRNTIRALLAAGINVKGYFIYGFPGETSADMQETYKLAAELKDDARKSAAHFRTSVFQFRPYQGTEIYHDLGLEGSKPDYTLDETLTNDVGRMQFNLHAKNYSACTEDELRRFISSTLELNNA